MPNAAGGFTDFFSNVAGQPFSAQQETQTIQTLIDGTRIIGSVQKMAWYRDSRGRTRSEKSQPQPPGIFAASTPPVSITISDPVSGYSYTFNSRGGPVSRSRFSGTRMAVAEGSRAASGASTLPADLTPKTVTDQLGTQSIEGVSATGTRSTTTYPVGLLGNDRPFSTVNEVWMSQELGIAVLTKMSDPRTGETTTKLKNYVRAEPDASLFLPPGDITGSPVPK